MAMACKSFKKNAGRTGLNAIKPGCPGLDRAQERAVLSAVSGGGGNSRRHRVANRKGASKNLSGDLDLTPCGSRFDALD